ncbi:MAG: hypothetical protein Q9159_004064 [Coniocarpon cinnabarinum]
MANQYSFSLTTFSPSGKLVQIEYALNAVNQGVTSLGIKATNGVVLATEKKSTSTLIDNTTQSKVSLITPNIGMVYSGMGPDYRILVDRARKVSHTGYKRIYNEYPPTRILVQDVARVMQEATQSAGVRPYGVSLLMAGWDDGIEPDAEGEEILDEKTGEKKKLPRKTGGILKGGPSLYQVDPSGSYFPWKATAIGKGATSAKTFLEKRHTEELELEDAIIIALLTLKETIEGEMTGENIEIGLIGDPANDQLGFEGQQSQSQGDGRQAEQDPASQTTLKPNVTPNSFATGDEKLGIEAPNDELPCTHLLGLDSLHISVKTSASNAHQLIPSLVNHTLRCLPRHSFSVYSDLDDTVSNVAVHDALDGLSSHLYNNDSCPELRAYREMKELHEQSPDRIDFSEILDADVKEDAPGWKLDKWKNMQMLLKVYHNPDYNDKPFYFFTDADTHVILSNLVRWLDLLDPDFPWWSGAPAWFPGNMFAHGGTGYLLSRAAIAKAVHALEGHWTHWEDVLVDDCCGDAAMAKLMHSLDVPLLKAWPMLQGETVETLDYAERMWCFPVLSQHHMTGMDVEHMFDFEQDWLRRHQGLGRQPIKHKDVFEKFVWPLIQENGGHRDGWDNLSQDVKIPEDKQERDEDGNASNKDEDSANSGSVDAIEKEEEEEEDNGAWRSAEACSMACDNMQECLQWSWKPDKCRLGTVIRLGKDVSKDEEGQHMVSGWLVHRVERFRRKMEPCLATWIYQHENEMS